MIFYSRYRVTPKENGFIGVEVQEDKTVGTKYLFGVSVTYCMLAELGKVDY